MPQITSLRPTRRAGRFAVHVDGEYAFAVSEAFLARYGLYEGRAYEPDDYTALVGAASAEAALTDACRLVDHRARSERELRERLARKGHDDETIRDVVERLRHQGLVDDEAFARAFVADKVNLSGWGARRIAGELRRHGVHDDVARRALAGLDDEAELRRAVTALGRLGPPRPPLDKARARALAALTRRGFSSETCHRAVRAWLAGEVPRD